MRLFGSERIIGLVNSLGLDDDTPIDARILSNSIESAQKRIEDQNFKRRKNVLTYDDVMNQQRNIIYKQRSQVLNGENISDTITSMIKSEIEEVVGASTSAEDPKDWSLDAVKAHFLGYLCAQDDFEYLDDEKQKLKKEDIISMLENRAEALYHEKEKMFGEERFREVERAVLLESVDRAWMDHIDAMDELKGSIGLQAYAQRDPVNEYRIQGAEMFDNMVEEIKENTVRKIFTVIPREEAIRRIQIAKPLDTGDDGTLEKKKKTVVRTSAKVGRNDPCPCGSGKKYKNCCGSNANKNN